MRWKPVVDYEGYYEVSDQGSVRSVDRMVGGRQLKGKELSLSTNPQGYKHVGLHKNGVRKGFFVHTLVAEAFFGPCPEGCIVLHGTFGAGVDGVDNLEYGSPFQNNVTDKLRDGTFYRSPVIRSDGLEYDGVVEAADELGLDHGNIIRCCNGQRETCGGYGWSYV
jgi:hypothetical protein